MATFKAGFGRVTITPPLGVKMAGYYHERISEGVLDELEANCLAVNDGENTAVLLSCDLLYCNQPQIDYTRDLINSTTGVPIDNIFICCTHTHTGPYCLRGSCISSPVATHDTSRADPAYLDMLSRKMATAAQLAINDLAETTADIGRNTVHDVAFIRRFLMKDGSAKPFPGFNHPDIVRPIGEPDETVQVLRFNREGNSPPTIRVTCVKRWKRCILTPIASTTTVPRATSAVWIRTATRYCTINSAPSTVCAVPSTQDGVSPAA